MADATADAKKGSADAERGLVSVGLHTERYKFGAFNTLLQVFPMSAYGCSHFRHVYNVPKMSTSIRR